MTWISNHLLLFYHLLVLLIFKKTCFLSVLQIGYFYPEFHWFFCHFPLSSSPQSFSNIVLSHLWTFAWKASIGRTLSLPLLSLCLPWCVSIGIQLKGWVEEAGRPQRSDFPKDAQTQWPWPQQTRVSQPLHPQSRPAGNVFYMVDCGQQRKE